MRTSALAGGLALALALGACSSPPDTADTVDPASTTTAAPQASIELRPVVAPGLPCDDLPSGVDPTAVLPHEDPEMACAEVGPGEGVDLARAEVAEGAVVGSGWVIEVEVTDADRGAANDLLNTCAVLDETCPTGQLAIVVDETIISAPQVNDRNIADETFVINGGAEGFTRAEAEALVERISR